MYSVLSILAFQTYRLRRASWLFHFISFLYVSLVVCVSEYDQEIPQSQTADNPMAQRGRATQPSQDTRKTN